MDRPQLGAHDQWPVVRLDVSHMNAAEAARAVHETLMTATERREYFVADAQAANAKAIRAGAKLWGRARSGGDRLPSGRLIGLVLSIAALAVALAQTIVAVVLAPFAHGLGTNVVGATWLLTAFMLSSAIATPIAGRLGDQIGHRRVIVAGLVLLIAGSILAALSTRADWYGGALAGRIVQGLAGGVFPCAFGLARQALPARRLPGLVATLSAMFGVGGALGMVVAGPLADIGGLASVFWLVAVLAALALLGILVAPAQLYGVGRRARLDLPGGALLAAALVAGLLAISQGRQWGWNSAAVLGLIAAAVILAAGFAVTERHTSTPLVDMRLLVGRNLLAVNLATIVIAVGMFAAVVLVPLLAQTPARLGYGFGFDPAQTGLLIAPMGLLMVLAAPLTPRLSKIVGSRAVFQIGAVLAAIGLLGFAALHDKPATVALSGAVLGIAYGLGFGSLGNLVIDATPPDQTGAATGINTILRTVGGAIGSAMAAAIVASTANVTSGAPAEAGYTTAFVVAAAIALGAAGIAAAIPSARRAANQSEAAPAAN